MSQPTQEQVRISRIKFFMLIGIAIIPIVFSVLLFQYLPQLRPLDTTNQGELILPPLKASDVSPSLLHYKNWLLLQTTGYSCDADCKKMLYLSRQVITGLGKDAGRVERVLVTPNIVDVEFERHLADEHMDVTVMSIDVSMLDHISENFPLLFLVDPNGNIMMFYSLNTAGKPMLKDLKHLLKISKIG